MRVSKILIVVSCIASLLLAALPYSSVHSEAEQRGTPTPIVTETATTASEVLFGPKTGNLKFPLDFVETGLKVRDFRLKLRFFTPYTAADGNWLLAILFRTKGRTAASGFALGITAGAEWALSSLGSNSQQVTLDSGRLPQLKINTGDYNDIELTVDGDFGVLVINDEEIATLALFNLRGDAVDEDLLVGVFGNRDDKLAHYENLTVASSQSNPDLTLTRTPGVSIPCLVTTLRATALLEQPDRNAARVVSVPGQKRLEGYGLSSDLLWVKVRYGGQEGWVIRFSVNVGNGCADLPIEEP